MKPYVVLILDTSGSMLQPTGSGPTSCGKPDTRINHAVCAVNNIVNSYGDMVFAFARFRENTAGTFSTSCDANGNQDGNPGATIPTPSGGDQCSTQGPYCGDCVPSTGVAKSCTTNGNCSGGDTCVGGKCSGPGTCTQADSTMEMLAPLVDGNNASTALVTNGTCNSCSINAGSDPEVWGVSQYTFTPLAGVLNGDKRYWQGLQATDGTVIVAGNVAGFDPINRDPINTAFLPPAGQTTCDPSATCTGANCCVSQCRPYITILLTDGDETCTTSTNTNAAAASLLGTVPRNDQVSISAIARASNVVTVTTSSAHPFKAGDTVAISGVSPTAFNGTFTVASVGSTTQFTYAQVAANATGSGGFAGHLAYRNKYRIVTKPIGFGVTPGSQTIEDIAHNGGAIDVSGVNEGYYAADEAGLELAITKILEDSIRSEKCNGLDDDCDTKIDEDFPTKGNACTNGELGVCARTGTLVCRADGTGVECNAPVIQPGTEICNQMDDDCDGKVDEGLTCTCNGTAEVCDNKDNDCDGIVDEDIAPKQCAVTNAFGSCPGTELCVNGTYGACAGQTPTAEICNGVDDNCDGVADGFQQACSNMVTPGGPASDNPGDPSHSPIPQNICHPGTKTCPVAPPGNGTFGTCTGEQTPLASDPCNGLDDDCDNLIDEDFVPADCSTNCGVGQTMCTNGQITCNSTPATNDNTCNNVDDDCDGKIDEDWACDPSPTCTGTQCCACGTGTTCEVNKCINGQVTCTTTQAINPEQCNCLDDDCDGTTDEGTLCSGGATCTNCQCAYACSPGEFPCPLGKKCSPNNFCINDPCSGVTCPDVNGAKQVCVDQLNNGVCVDACSQQMCTSGEKCLPSAGECRPDDCVNFPGKCAANENCIVDPNTGYGVCTSNPCLGVTCPSDKYCEAGECISSCADITCPAGQRCRLGACEADPCGHACPFGQACNDSTGQCIGDPCKDRVCSQGQWCNPNDGMCEPDPCVGTTCPSPDQICKGGTCYSGDAFLPDAGVEHHVTVGGGGCATSGGHAGWILALGVLLLRRRRHVGGAQ